MKHTDTKAVNPRLHKGSNGTYEIRWSEGNRSKRKSTKTTDEQSALIKLGEFIISRNEAKRAVEDPLVRDILKSYTREHVEPNLRSAPSYSRQVDCINALADGLGGLRVEELRNHHIIEYGSARAAGRHGKRKAGDSTVRRELGVLVAAMNHAKRNRILDDVPHVPLPKSAPPKDLWLTEGELLHLFEAANRLGGRGRTFVRIAAHTAARKESILRLLWKHVDFEAGVINFQDIDLPSTKKRRVPVPMCKPLAEYLRSRWISDGEPHGDIHVLGNHSSVRREFEAICKLAAGLTRNDKFEKVTPHTLRHTWATLAAKNRVPVFEIAGVLGDNVQTVTRVYAKHHPDHLRGAVKFMDSLG